MSELFVCAIIYHNDFGTLYSVDQTSRFAASGLGLYCLPLSLLWDARHNWVSSIPERGHSLDIKTFYSIRYQMHDYYVNSLDSYFRLSYITKTRLFKYIENFTTKKRKIFR